MATLATQFKAALSRIEPKVDAENAAEAHKLVTAALKADDKLKKLGISTFIIGSYGRDVSIKRVKDVDVFMRLEKATDSLRPSEILDHVNDVLEDVFPGQVTRQHRSVMIEFPDFDLSVDVVIARPCVDHPTEHWQIPEKIEEDGRASWIETNPIKMSELTNKANDDFLLSTDGVYVPLVKLIRQIRRTWVDEQPGGYYFEVLAYHAFQDLEPDKNTVAEYLCVILREIADRLPDYVTDGPDDPTLDEHTITTKATKEQIEAAAERIAEAAQLAEDALEDKDICASALKWQELLGKTQQTKEPEFVFALPEACNADGTEKPRGALVKGAPAVPAGRDRYA
ncbi:nucleotidyltransferase [Amycolatopsis sp. EV170708-02-1]|uniref:nucleotidyltransferase domain-containing protein n=1 Tax=Amycolatopsis sp. EV170708-02-1 TaxID=2919322 RepID=UPI001F0C7C88|nr:nucleotidyltransferase [Amycolatopsis sp. EV170708-02-1]UMP01268.1 nucleotidyltransferase [Amycolatopsis sp. EV170708-02-1]